jgi:hypothetical protein
MARGQVADDHGAAHPALVPAYAGYAARLFSA